MRYPLALLSLVGWLTILSYSCAACREAAEPTAEVAYGAALLRCVDKATTLAESKACRAKVDEEWHITQTATDAGGER